MVYEYPVITHKREELINITDMVNESIIKSRVKNGVCIVFTTHTTAAITINENADPDVKTDIIKFLNEKIPLNHGFKHLEGNSDAHIKSSLFGCSQQIIINDGKPLLGIWQGIYFCEFDGPRNRRIYIKILEG
ncbi:hypothetical protein OSSY52_02870 [Tepiditoga spiralis]|uniref:Secondary thiamine-phosphate synthase enzyme n=1 Tax=Tepiditoga spiralis TaxID=2108365 RepID=A0A7G1G4K8_9BACT|nr:secondary thiamine-phosphate synthase enzyme YjbQ [Tepiditoga spiralis]BBE30146.1 hypothetical protein OSSY52_02870 [Tepiditoga spiralis]